MEVFWNILHYFMYKAVYRAHLFFNKINPFMLIHKLPFQKRLYERRGIDIYTEMDDAFKQVKGGSPFSGRVRSCISILYSSAINSGELDPGIPGDVDPTPKGWQGQ